jgi:putative hemolysin
MSGSALAELVVLVVCIILAALASATETAMTSVGRIRIRHLAEEGNPRAAVLHKLQQDPNRFLSTILVVNTFALILASSATTLLGVQVLPRDWGLIGDFAVSVLLSVFLLIFAEVTPKSLAIRQAERWALLTARSVDSLASALRPVLWFITGVTRAITGGRAAHAPFLTEQELMTILSVSEEQGVIEEEEREMISGIIEIGDKIVREVMIPRTDITAIERHSNLQEIADMIRNQGHTRLPVYEGDIDHMAGLVHAKDILIVFAKHEEEGFDLEKILRPIRFTPEQKKVDELLHEMQDEKVHMMIVVDEYGGTAGLVTLEDLLEEIVGEIRDEYDTGEEEPITLIDDCQALIDARLSMDALNERLRLGIAESQEYDSVGGYVYSVLGTIPEAGTSFEQGGVRWTVEQVNGQRILQVRLISKDPWPDDELVHAGLEPPSRDSDVREQASAGEGSERAQAT